VVDGQSRNRIARLNPDGSLDSSFNPNANGPVRALAIQTNGRIVVAGGFTTLSGVARSYIARLNSDGTLDGTFNVTVNSGINAILLQQSGRIIIGGGFTTVNGVGRSLIARLNADGSLIDGFDANMFGVSVNAIAIQEDGKLVIGGPFGQVGGFDRPRLARITGASGSLDTSFVPDALNADVESIVVQTDGRILIGGLFTTIGGVVTHELARLNSDGSRDTTFFASLTDTVYSVALQSDGKILVGGSFTVIGITGRNHAARLTNPDAAFQSLSASQDGSTVTWLRSGAAPELELVVFEESSDASVWSLLGSGARIAGGWQLSGLSLPADQNLYIRARGVSRGGWHNGSSSVLESVRVVYLPEPHAVALLAAGAGVLVVLRRVRQRG
ncbi:MAG: delta-60 repeat domain-containing protein, partial [Myxococcales bacterium]|nr:delta-60 repeat domain-containing protein [Myxococcales bacterium]